MYSNNFNTTQNVLRCSWHIWRVMLFFRKWKLINRNLFHLKLFSINEWRGGGGLNREGRGGGLINIFSLHLQDCNNIVISWLYQTCWNNLAAGLIISTRVVTWDKQCKYNLFTFSWQTCYKLWNFSVCVELAGPIKSKPNLVLNITMFFRESKLVYRCPQLVVSSCNQLGVLVQYMVQGHLERRATGAVCPRIWGPLRL